MKNFKIGELKVKVENLDDIWYLSHIISSDDLVKGKTFRKIKIGQEPNVKVVKKPFFLEIQVERVEFHKYTNSLRVMGIITSGPEQAPKGSHHSFDINEGTIITIHKKIWYNYQKQKIQEAENDKLSEVLICVMDREEAYFALMKKYGFDFLSNLKGNVQKKGDEIRKKNGSFYNDIADQIEQYVTRYNINNIVIGSPAFWKEDLLKVLQKKHPNLLGKITLATCNNVGKNGINEVLKREEVKTVLAKDRATKEIVLVEQLLGEISKGGKFAYGIEAVKIAAEAGAIEIFLISDKCINQIREDGKYKEIDSMMGMIDKMQGKIKIISSAHDGGKKLDGLGGIGAILRYKLNY
ncbi:MAG: mRNA surveillance protein pelota [Nanoarchaeota archaeon]|nr:mRNA surveillance protein pelota [Nanoarchaeota archaeon]